MTGKSNSIDIFIVESGNSRLHTGYFENGKLTERHVYNYPDNAEHLHELIAQAIGDSKPSIVAASSVSGKLREKLYTTLYEIFGNCLHVAQSTLDIPVKVTYSAPEMIGIDRVFAAHAAFQHFNGPCVVIDAGTAVTVDAVDKDGTFLGGFIFPGAELLGKSLSDNTSLPLVNFSNESREIGTSTETCIGRAIFAGFAAAVNELADIASNASGKTNNVAVTGGNSDQILPALKRKVEHLPNLTMTGIALLAESLPVFSVSKNKID